MPVVSQRFCPKNCLCHSLGGSCGVTACCEHPGQKYAGWETGEPEGVKALDLTVRSAELLPGILLGVLMAEAAAQMARQAVMDWVEKKPDAQFPPVLKPFVVLPGFSRQNYGIMTTNGVDDVYETVTVRVWFLPE